MFKCPECGATNKLGGIFCHECGAKLDLENLQPAKPEREFKLGKLLRSLVMLLILAGVVAVLVGFFLPVERTEVKAREPRLQDKLERALDHVLNDPLVNKGEDFRLNSKAVTYLARHVAGLEQALGEDNGAGVLMPQNVVVELLPRDIMKISVTYSVFDKLTTTATVAGRVSVSDNSPQFELLKAHVGRVPLPGPLQKVPKDRVYAQFADTPELKGLKGKTQSIRVERDKLVFTPVPREPERENDRRSRRKKLSTPEEDMEKDAELGGDVDFGEGFDEL